ncbi:hypothetical protein Tco_0051632 [Tanacetum coccineum]
MFLNSLTQTDMPKHPIHCPQSSSQKDYEEFDNVESFEHLFMAELENAESTVKFDAKEYEEHQENPNQETPTKFPNPWEHIAHAREEFLKRKCCSFQKKDLEKHYNCKSQRFYYLNGVDDVNLKQVFLNSFPESFENEAYWALEARNKKFLAEFERTRKCLGTACDDKYLQIKEAARSGNS